MILGHKPKALTAREILVETAQDHDMTVSELLARSRKIEFVRARFDAMHRLRTGPTANGLQRTVGQIARILGERDHSCVVSGLKRWQQMKPASAFSESTEGKTDNGTNQNEDPA